MPFNFGLVNTVVNILLPAQRRRLEAQRKQREHAQTIKTEEDRAFDELERELEKQSKRDT